MVSVLELVQTVNWELRTWSCRQCYIHAMEFKPHGHKGWKRMMILCAGWGCIAFGVIGGFIPILQGWVFVVAGLLILSTEYVWAHRIVVWTRNRFPRIAKAMDRVKADAERIAARFTGKSESQ